MEVRGVEGKVVEGDIGYAELEQRDLSDRPHLLPRKMSIVRAGSSVAKETAGGNGRS